MLGASGEAFVQSKTIHGTSLLKPLVRRPTSRGIEKAGGRVVFDGYANHRVYAKNARYPGLNMSRCIGEGFFF